MTALPRPPAKRRLVFSVILAVLAVNASADTPPNLSTDIDWSDSGGTGASAAFQGTTDIELAFNHARRQEEIQLGAGANTISDLVLPSQAIWDQMTDDAKALFILNNERKSRMRLTANTLGLPFAGVERYIDDIASNYAVLLHNSNTAGHYQPSGNPAVDNPRQRINDDPILGSALVCNEEIKSNEAIATFSTQSSDPLDESSIKLPIERAIYGWVYADSSNNWANRETVLLQDQGIPGGGSSTNNGYQNNFSSNNHEGFIGIHKMGSAGYNPSNTSGNLYNYGTVVVLNTFDPVSDADAQSRGCLYEVLLHTENLPQPANRAPLARDDAASTLFNKPSQPIYVLTNDSDPDNDPLQITNHTEPSNGSVNRIGNSFVYTPDNGFSGLDSFTYTITDGHIEETTATAAATAIAVYSPDESFTAADTFTFTINGRDGGIATADATGTASIFIDPNDPALGSQTVTFTITNTLNGEAVATATASASVSNDNATATATASAIAVYRPDTIISDTDSTTFTISQGTATASADADAIATVEYTPSQDPNIQGQFTYTVINSNGQAIEATTIAMAMATATATVTALTEETATVTIDVAENARPSFTLSQTSTTADSDAGKVTVPGWVASAEDGEGGVQLPFGGNSSDVIHFFITSNSNPGLFTEAPWVSYPSQSLHFTPKPETGGTAEVCMKAVDQHGSGLSSEIQCFSITINKIQNNPPSIILKQPASLEVKKGSGEVNILAFITEARDGEGGTQLPFGGDSKDIIYFNTVKVSNPNLFIVSPWISYPSQSLHFNTRPEASGSSEVCVIGIDKKGQGLSSEQACFTIKIEDPAPAAPVPANDTPAPAPSNGESTASGNGTTKENPPEQVQTDTATQTANEKGSPSGPDFHSVLRGVISENGMQNQESGGGTFGMLLTVALGGLGIYRRKYR